VSGCHRLPRPHVRRRPPRLVLVIELEELPRVQVDAETFEDERRLLAWLSSPKTHRRLADAMADAVERVAS
jgi:hypothetical protein